MEYLTTEDVILMNMDIMRDEGRQSNLLNPNLLDSGLMRVQQVAFYVPDTDIVVQAAYVAAGVAKAHSFEDGNKRTAFAAMTTFVDLNGYEFDADPIEAGEAIALYVERTEQGHDDEAETYRFAEWLRGHIRLRSE